MSYLIIALLSGSIILSSMLTMRLSVNDENNWLLLAKIYKSNTAVALAPPEQKINLIEDTIAINNDCTFTITTDKTETISLVQYLNSTGRNSSFDNREILANELNINNYTGSAKQNLTILKNLKEKDKTCVVKTPTITNTKIVNK